jgi:hypothetical protein
MIFKKRLKDRIIELETENEKLKSRLPVTKNSFTRQEVIKVLNWLMKSNYHTQGYNGWNQYGHSPYYGVDSEYVLKDAEKNCF